MPSASIRLRVYQLTWTVFFAALCLATYPLWLHTSNFPAIPLIRGFDFQPIGPFVLLVLAVGLSMQWMTSERLQRTGLYAVCFSLLLAFLSDQHRIQAWAYQFIFVAAILLVDRQRTLGVAKSLQRLRWLVISIYIFSCISKLDATFLASLGPQMMDRLLQVLGLAREQIPTGLFSMLVICLPIGEGLIGLGLLWGRFSRSFVVLAVAMHLCLIAIVGPWGWHQQWGVVLWNLFFILQVILLFWPSRRETKVEPEMRFTAADTIHQRVATIAVGFVLLFPITTVIGVGDHWPGWELYAPRTSRAEVLVSANSVVELPEGVRRHCEAANSEGWCRLDLAKWSLADQYAPIYPEDRFQLGVALSMKRWLKEDRSIRVFWLGTADRWTGERETKVFRGFDELERFARGFRFNAMPAAVDGR